MRSAIAAAIALTGQSISDDHFVAATCETFFMPYYPVTHTSLVEGDNEVKAAEKVLAKLRSDSSVEFLVKFYESITRHVTVVDAVTSQAALASSRGDQ